MLNPSDAREALIGEAAITMMALDENAERLDTDARDLYEWAVDMQEEIDQLEARQREHPLSDEAGERLDSLRRQVTLLRGASDQLDEINAETALPLDSDWDDDQQTGRAIIKRAMEGL